MTISKYLVDGVSIVFSILGLFGPLLLVGGKSPKVVGLVLSALFIALVWTLVGGLIPVELLPLHTERGLQTSLGDHITFNWINGLLVGIFGACLYLFNELFGAIVKSRWISGRTTDTRAALSVGAALLLLLFAISVIIAIVSFFLAQALLASVFPNLTFSSARSVVELGFTIPTFFLIVYIYRFSIWLGQLTRKITNTAPQILGVLFTVVGVGQSLIFPLLDLLGIHVM